MGVTVVFDGPSKAFRSICGAVLRGVEWSSGFSVLVKISELIA